MASMGGIAGGGAPISGTPPMSKANTATYGRAKERVGLETSSALKSLREVLASRGLTGGGGERQGVSDILMHGQSELGETNRGMAEQDADREFAAREAGKNRDFSAAQEGLRAAMSEPEGGMGTPGDPYGTKANARMQAIEQAKQQIRLLTGYSGGGGLY